MKLAIFDVGSNTIKFRLWEAGAGDAPRIILAAREPVRLGAPVFEHGRLDGATIGAAVEVFERLGEAARQRGADAIRAVATSAMREAANPGDLIAAIRRATGIELEIIAEAEEARLITLGALTRHPGAAAHHLIFDIGGGSIEVIEGGEGRALRAHSLPLGAVRLTRIFFPELPPPAGVAQRAGAHVREALRMAFPVEPGGGPRPVCLAGGGTVQALAAVTRLIGAIADPGEGVPPPVTLGQIEGFAERLGAVAPAAIAAQYGVEPRRAEIFLAGAIAAIEILRHFEIEALTPTPTGLSDGILAEWLAGAVG